MIRSAAQRTVRRWCRRFERCAYPWLCQRLVLQAPVLKNGTHRTKDVRRMQAKEMAEQAARERKKAAAHGNSQLFLQNRQIYPYSHDLATVLIRRAAPPSALTGEYTGGGSRQGRNTRGPRTRGEGTRGAAQGRHKATGKGHR
jgi:hypothetical protein